MMLSVDLNCDLGEGFGRYRLELDEELMGHASSVNIACGFHAGDPAVMCQTVNSALQREVAIGAHPGLPDLQGFGRRNMAISPPEAYQMTLYQVGALHAFVHAAGGALHHVKPHGALYNMAADDLKLAEAIAQAVYDFDAALMLYGLSGSKLEEAAKGRGLPFAREVFADRTYQRNGLLTPRNEPNALVIDAEEAMQQVLSIVKDGKVRCVDGAWIPLAADTVCVHGDGKEALAFAQMVRNRLESEGIAVKAC